MNRELEDYEDCEEYKWMVETYCAIPPEFACEEDDCEWCKCCPVHIDNLEYNDIDYHIDEDSWR